MGLFLIIKRKIRRIKRQCKRRRQLRQWKVKNLNDDLFAQAFAYSAWKMERYLNGEPVYDWEKPKVPEKMSKSSKFRFITKIIKQIFGFKFKK